MGNKITVRDVAKFANVSVGTVSKYLNNHPGIGQKNREAIQNAIDKLGYKMNPIAQRFAKGISNTILLYYVREYPIEITTWLYELPIFQGIQDYLRGTKYDLHIAMESIDNENQIYDFVLEHSNNRGADGLIIVTSWELENRVLVKLLDSQFPFVIVGARNSIQASNDVMFDNFSAAEKIMQHLRQLGHKNIGIISGTKEQHHMAERLKGYFKQADILGQVIKKEWIKYGDYSMSSGYESFRQIQAGGELPTAIVCGNDYVAAGVIKAIKDAGLSVPDDISVVGFDNTTIAHVVEPSLTTVKLPSETVGKLAAKKLVNQIKTGSPVQRTILPCDVVIGQSTGKCANK